MEASDVFTQEIDDKEDPFAGTDFGDFEKPAEPAPPVEPERPVPEATDGLPVVDREGVRVEPTAEEAMNAGLTPLTEEQSGPSVVVPPPQVGPTPEAQAAMNALKAPHQTAPVVAQQAAVPAATPAPVAEDPPEAQTAAQEPVAGASPTASPSGTGSTETEPALTAKESAARIEALADDTSGAEAAAAAGQPGEPSEDAEALKEIIPPPDPTPEPSPSSSTTVAPPASSSSEEQTDGSSESSSYDDDAAPPDEKKDKNGRVTHRRYVIMKVEGGGKYSEIAWYDKAGVIVAKGTAGAKRQRYALARGQEDALKIGYAALGSPPRAHIVAVAVSAFQPRVVEPEAPKPERARLTIR